MLPSPIAKRGLEIPNRAGCTDHRDSSGGSPIDRDRRNGIGRDSYFDIKTLILANRPTAARYRLWRVNKGLGDPTPTKILRLCTVLIV